MFENKINNTVQVKSERMFAGSVRGSAVSDQSFSLLPALRNGLLAVAVVSVFSGCAQFQNSKLFSDDSQLQQAALQPSLAISRDIDLVRVNGLVGSAAEAAMIRLRVAAIYGPEVLIDELQVDERLSEAEWYNAVLDTAERMRDVEQFAITAENGQLTLNGSMPSQASADALANDAALASGQWLTVSNAISYPPSETIATATPQPVESTPTEQELSAQSIQSPAVAGTIPLPATNSAVVLEQRTALNDNSDTDLFVPPADRGIVRSAGSVNADDRDGDGIANSIDECNSRPGYPVNANGCQVLDGLLKNVRFQGDGSTLTPEAMTSLNNVARVMNDYPAARIAILAYTSNFGSALETRGQARDRARSVVAYLINKGVEGERLEAYAFGHLNDSDDQIKIKEVD